jgi:hypothetical protein
MTSPVLSEHNWPKETSTHVWGAWFAFSGPPKASEYRKCCHPGCSAVQYREIKGEKPGPATTERPSR